ncbi:sigma-70 family RNA polymerase sigma factor [Streptomyces sp. MUM 203J]|uniref:sigma-70 family RNA polymerase sigma factor n=1 Tax=Streptomyces sp. MUM 203J TaxID=2791990 RepID=UPI001F0395AE|nr:sigma-70 family RNA polymerase sigma factor [Streptomyces sp. MUM 203J]MCH0539856.1 sigma-70 family RNA polymerase sigma factor [Streptomyces sp. MUM 203J]
MTALRTTSPSIGRGERLGLPDRSPADEGTRVPRRADPRLDAALAARFTAGDEDALALAYQRWSPLVYTMARRSLGNPQDAEDVTQQVFLAAWRGRAGFRPERGALAGWIVGITRHAIVDALAARTRRADTVRAVAERNGEAVRQHSGDESDVALDRVLVAQNLRCLSPVQRRLLAMAVYGDMTQRQIAERTGLPLGTVKSHIRRAMIVLRRLMGPSR